MKTSNAMSFAETELSILCDSYPSNENPPIIKEFIPEILALVNKFGNSGQSGGSAPYVANAISDAVKKLCLFKPICDITGLDEEWSSANEGIIQNKRCSALFKQSDKKCYYLDAISFRSQSDSCWSTEHVAMPDGSIIESRQYIKSFPWKPKTFTIDIIDTDLGNGNFEFTIKDISQLDEVWKYYDRFYHTLTP